MLKFFLALLFLIFMSCTHKSKLTKLNTNLSYESGANGQSIGVDDHDDLIIQSEEHISSVFQKQQWTNTSIREEAHYEQHQLKDCRTYLADSRLGGYKYLSDITDPEVVKPPVEEKIGISNDGRVKLVKKQLLIKRLQAERRLEDKLRAHLKQLQQSHEVCSNRLRTARIKQGLPAEKYQPQGYYTSDGTWVTTQPGERTLDDAFAIRAKGKSRSAH